MRRSKGKGVAARKREPETFQEFMGPEFLGKRVAETFQEFLESYKAFRISTGLDKVSCGGYELCASVLDKAGRVSRQVKHLERNDPKPDWPDGAAEDIFGCIAYLMMLAIKYDIPMSSGVANELAKAVKQHGKGGKDASVGGCPKGGGTTWKTGLSGSVAQNVAR